MKLLVDMFACQTTSQFRGIGRYTLSLTHAMTKLRGANEMVVLADALYPESFETLRQEFIRLLPSGNFLPYFHESIEINSTQKRQYTQIAETLVKQAYQAVSPNVLLTPSPFEGWLEKGVVPSPNNIYPSYTQAAILYDLIPYIFRKEYLDTYPEYKTWYIDKLNKLHNYDLLLAISEATRQDAINILGIEPDQIVNISGATSSQFRKLILTDSEKQDFLHRFGISRPFVLNVGAGDFRKNRDGVLRAYSQLPRHIIDTHQLVLTYNDGEETVGQSKLASLGFSHGDVIAAQHIKDEDLVVLYNLCKLFFFPSLYEGFGLPVLEAMACGAPVIASNNSSLPEVVNYLDALFDATNDQQVGATLSRALTNKPFLEKLAAHGFENSKRFTWENTAQKAWNAIETMQKEKERTESRKIVSTRDDKSRMRIAYVSPMPPQMSGISDYSAELLPFLADHFDIDVFVESDVIASNPFIRDNLRFYPWTELFDRRDNYATVVYQMGNSPFHSHMIDLLQEMPGVVVQHDFFLNNIPFAEEYLEGKKGRFLREINYSHGLRGMIEYIKSGPDFVRTKWPINWRVLRNAQELIVHSKHQNELIEKFYAYDWKPMPAVIKPLCNIVPKPSPAVQKDIKNELGLDPNAFVFCSFGFLASTKLNLLTLRAFSAIQSKLDGNALLIFVGEVDSVEQRQKVHKLIDDLNLGEWVKITGYVSKKDFEKYLATADAAIQLRANSRGETSAAVLSCMGHGIPTIVNAHGTLNDYTDDDLVKLPDLPSVDDLAQAMLDLIKDDEFRTNKGIKAQKYIEEHHNPNKVSAAYAEVIYRAAQMDERELFRPILDSMLELKSSEPVLRSTARYAAANANLRCQPRILLDVTDIAKLDNKSGIQRVVKNLARELITAEDQSIHTELIRLNQERPVYAYRFAEILNHLPEQSLGEEIPVNIQPGDILFMLDSSWIRYKEFLPTFDSVRKSGGKIITMVYDIIPIRFPETCAQVVLDAFELWLNSAIKESDLLVCISKAVADDVMAYISEKQINSGNLDVSFIHLGADIVAPPLDSNIQDLVQRLADDKTSSLFLMVGTLEPRKGHSFVLDAFEKLWQSGNSCRLCFAGKIGWNIAELETRIRYHPELNKQLFLVEMPNDAEVNALYSSATALIAASTAEGFGLPIVEAALHKVPVLASDIPVFREVGGDGAMYFSLASPTSLADAVIAIELLGEDERLSMAKNIKVITWKECAEWTVEVIEGQRVYPSGLSRKSIKV